MKILHTSDWHLGKKLEGQSRIEEQKLFIDKLCTVVKEENIDLILIAGDIFDTYNPPAEAEKLFYDSLKLLSEKGERGIIIIPGNHDNPKRLSSIAKLVKDYGIIIYEKIFQEIEIGKYGSIDVYRSVEGGIFLEKNGERIYIYSLPFPSELTLNESFDDEDMRFNDKVREVLAEGCKKNDEDIPTIIMAHLYVAGAFGDNEEKTLELGGTKAIAIDDLPDVNYVALGHVHKPMRYERKKAYYAGSPIEYRVTENRFDKKIFVVDIEKESTKVKEIALENIKPIREYWVEGVEEAIEKSHSLIGEQEWVYLNIKLKEPIRNSDIRKIKLNKNVLRIVPIIESIYEEEKDMRDLNLEENIEELFIDFFKEESKGLEPTEEIKSLFMSLLGGETNETN